MSLYDDFNNGSKAYYDEVPRYKNPYSGSNHYDDSNYAAWEKGWKQASAEHNLFTENQALKAETQELKTHISILSLANTDEIIALKTEHAECMEENMFLVDDVARLKEKIDILRAQTVEISTLLREVFYYSTDSNIFSFRREKLIEYLKSLRVRVLAMEKEFLEKVIKNKEKA